MRILLRNVEHPDFQLPHRNRLSAIGEVELGRKRRTGSPDARRGGGIRTQLNPREDRNPRRESTGQGRGKIGLRNRDPAVIASLTAARKHARLMRLIPSCRQILASCPALPPDAKPGEGGHRGECRAAEGQTTIHLRPPRAFGAFCGFRLPLLCRLRPIKQHLDARRCPLPPARRPYLQPH
jgi:hypothetical protein